jgi:hypothetical protein
MEQQRTEFRFFEKLNDLTGLLYDLVDKAYKKKMLLLSPDKITLGFEFLKQKNKLQLINKFIQYSYKYWDEIYNKKDDFFINHADILFKDLPMNEFITQFFKDLFSLRDPKTNQYIVDETDREDLWGYFHYFVKTCIRHVHQERCPTIDIIPNQDGKRLAYYLKPTEFADINLEQAAKKWKISLDFKLILYP